MRVVILDYDHVDLVIDGVHFTAVQCDSAKLSLDELC